MKISVRTSFSWVRTPCVSWLNMSCIEKRNSQDVGCEYRSIQWQSLFYYIPFISIWSGKDPLLRLNIPTACPPPVRIKLSILFIVKSVYQRSSQVHASGACHCTCNLQPWLSRHLFTASRMRDLFTLGFTFGTWKYRESPLPFSRDKNRDRQYMLFRIHI